jgi:drug/metabolite transporter (DMT)-like permease
LQRVAKAGEKAGYVAGSVDGAVLSALISCLALPCRHPAMICWLALLDGVMATRLLVVRVSRYLPAPEIALLGLLEVVFGVASAWLWAGEPLSINVLLGGGLVLAALVARGWR